MPRQDSAVRGRVWLVGAGPGEIGLLTLRAKELLSQADVVVYDRLVNDELLSFAPQARLVYVGKQAASHPVPQWRINEILVEEGRAGNRVVRLKGGDPYIFGRGGEEARELRAAGVPFEVVPGVTSAVAALSYAGIPATDRSCAPSVHLITGHRREGDELELDYDALVRVGGTLVFMMAIATTPAICEGLLAAGMDPQTPAAMGERGTTPLQRRVDATLGTMAEQVVAQRVKSPAIFVVGEVCALASELDWFDELPLRGRTVAVTRPKDRAGTLSRRLRALGADVIPVPCIESHPYDPAGLSEVIEHIHEHAWVVLTSAVGVRCLVDAIAAAGRDLRWLSGVGIAAIGPATAAALRRNNLSADYVPGVYDGEHLASGLAERMGGDGSVLLFRSEQGTASLPDGLTAAGVRVTDVACYETVLVSDGIDQADAGRIRAGEADFVTVTSASTADGFAAAFPDLDPASVTAVCIGPTSRAAAERHGYACVQSDEATIDSLIEAIIES